MVLLECITLSNLLLTFYALVPLICLLCSDKLRYYFCYIFYVLYISTIGLLLVPYYLFRPRDPINFKFTGKCLKHFTKVIGIKWELRNGHILAEQRGAVIAANHQSILDIMGMFNIWEVMVRCTAVAKKEILYVPPFGPAAWLAGLIYIDRVNPKKANQQLVEASKLLHQKTKLWLFPEGTRNKDGKELLPFKKGAFRVAIECQAPILPLVFSPYYFIDSKQKTFKTGKIIISCLEPISTKGLTLNDLASLMEQTYKIMNDEYLKLSAEVSPLIK